MFMDMPEEKIDPRVIQSEELGWKILFNIKTFSKVHLLLILISKNYSHVFGQKTSPWILHFLRA